MDMSLRMLLHDINLSQYEGIFRDKGYDSARVLLNMNRQDLQQLKEETQILPGHLMRLQQEISHRNVRRSQRPNAPVAAQMATFLRDPARNVLCDPTRNVLCETETGTGPAFNVGGGPVPKVPMSEDEKKIRRNLFSPHSEWSSAKLVSLQFSTAMGCHAMQDPKKCGGRTKVYRCSSVVSKRKRQDDDGDDDDDDGPFPCPHLLHWSRNKKTGKNWCLDKEKSCIEHSPWCTSKQKVSKCELVHDRDFIKHVKIEKKSTGANCAKNAIGRMGRMDGSVMEHTARRAQNATKRWNIKDYYDDWNKIKGWVRQYMESNRESRAEVMVDSENRSVVPMSGPMFRYYGASRHADTHHPSPGSRGCS